MAQHGQAIKNNLFYDVILQKKKTENFTVIENI